MDQKIETPRGKRLMVSARGVASHTPRQLAYAILEEGETEDGWSRLVEFAMIALIVSNVIMVIMETVPSIYQPHRWFFAAFETFTVYAFGIEYAVRVWCSLEDPRIGYDHPVTGRLRFAMRPMMIIDFISFAPFFLTMLTGGALDLRALRVLRLLRLLKIARYSQALPAMLGVLYAERRALLGSFILLLCTVCASGEVMYLVEGRGQPKAFGTLPDSMYWAITTLSTVGYGDEVPLTGFGKLVAAVTMVAGLVLFAMPIGIISKGFVDGLHRREFSITWSMVKRQPLFNDFSVEAVGQIVDLMGAALVQDHTRIAVAGHPAENLYLVISGRARAEDDSGVYDLEAGDMFGEESLTDDAVYGKTVVARTEVRLMVLPSDELRRISRKYPLLARRIRNEAPW